MSNTTKNPNLHAKTIPTLAPYLIVSDVQKAVDFYQTAFGFLLAGEPH